MFHVKQYIPNNTNQKPELQAYAISSQFRFCMWVGTIIIMLSLAPSPSSFSDPLQYRASVRSVSDNTV